MTLLNVKFLHDDACVLVTQI